jgi:hypothetical protein
MRAKLTTLVAAVLATTTLVAPARAGVLCSVAGSDRCPAWSAAYDSAGTPSLSFDHTNGEAMSPDGRTVVLTGQSASNTPGAITDYATVAFDTATGAQRWVARFSDSSEVAGQSNYGMAAAFSPDGTRVFVTGVAGDNLSPSDGHYMGDIETIAYDATTGSVVWEHRYDDAGGVVDGDPVGDQDYGLAVAVAPDGAHVYVAGRGSNDGVYSNYLVLALDAATGASAWESEYNAKGGWDFAEDLAVAPDGSRVYVSGVSKDKHIDDIDVNGQYVNWVRATLALDARTGARLWVHRRHEANSLFYFERKRIRIAPDGDVLEVAPLSIAALDPATGVERWSHTFETSSITEARAVTIDGDTDSVVVAGATGDDRIKHFAVVAYDATTGAERWHSTYAFGSCDVAMAAAVAKGKVYVSGFSGVAPGSYAITPALCPDMDEMGLSAMTTVAFDLATGAQAWVSRFTPSPTEGDTSAARPFVENAWANYVDVTGSRVVVSGTLHYLTDAARPQASSYAEDYGVIGYDF